jgi:hypothetical protein
MYGPFGFGSGGGSLTGGGSGSSGGVGGGLGGVGGFSSPSRWSPSGCGGAERLVVPRTQGIIRAIALQGCCPHSRAAASALMVQPLP